MIWATYTFKILWNRVALVPDICSKWHFLSLSNLQKSIWLLEEYIDLKVSHHAKLCDILSCVYKWSAVFCESVSNRSKIISLQVSHWLARTSTTRSNGDGKIGHLWVVPNIKQNVANISILKRAFCACFIVCSLSFILSFSFFLSFLPSFFIFFLLTFVSSFFLSLSPSSLFFFPSFALSV